MNAPERTPFAVNINVFRRVSFVLLGIVLTSIFFVASLPWHTLRETLARTLEAELGFPVELGTVSISFLGPFPALGIFDSFLKPSGREPIPIEALRIHLAVVPSWLRGDPAIRIQVRSVLGHGTSTLLLGKPRGAKGSVHDIDFTQLRALELPFPIPLDGTGDANFNFLLRPEGVDGGLSVFARNGMLHIPQLPFPVGFDQLHAVLHFQGHDRIEIQSLEFEGSGTFVHAQGELVGEPGHRSPLHANLQVEAQIHERGLWPLARRIGILVEPDGSARFVLSGPVTSLQVFNSNQFSEK